MVWGRVVKLGAACLLAALWAAAACGDEELRGTVLTAGQTAPDFTLTDQFGSDVTLSGLRGDVVLLTFLYTHCPDICPVVAGHLADVRNELATGPGGMDGVSILAVSVDPERDTVSRAREYSELYGMLTGWRYLVGDRGSLEGVWADYYVSPVPATSASGSGPQAREGSVDALTEGLMEVGLIDHQAPVYLVDPDGVLRVVHTLPMRPADVAADVRSLR